MSRFMGADGPNLDSLAVDDDEMNDVIERIQSRAKAMQEGTKKVDTEELPMKKKGTDMMELIKDLKGKEYLFDLRAYNSKKVRSACIPAANGHFSARALACFYNSFISTEGRILRAETCQKAVEPVAFETFESMDGSSGTKTMQWGLGYQLYPFKLSSGEVQTAFGHSGVGGSLG
jgi:hypothetical protein